MQDVPNYGSLMQAFALKQLLLENGADEVVFLAINPGENLEKPSSIRKVKKILYSVLSMQLFDKIKLRRFYRRTQKEFEKFHVLLGSESIIETNDVDMVVIGSDEVFNCCQYSSWGYTLQLYGKIDCPYIISYAGSFGNTHIEDLYHYQIAEEIGTTMQNLKAISVRDDNSYEIVKKITKVTPLIHLDPVLIYGFNKEISNQNKYIQENFILIYSYNGRISNKEEICMIKDFACKKGVKILSLFCQYDWCDDEIRLNNPMDLFSYFKNASFVITDTFHGSVFSIITHCKFCALARDSNKDKLGSLLSMLDIDSHLTTFPNMIEKILSLEIDYKSVDDKLYDKRLAARSYLKQHLNLAKENSYIKK